MNCLVCCLSGLGNCVSTIPLIKALHSMGHEVDVQIAPSRGAGPVFETVKEVRKVYEKGSPLPEYDVACCTHLCMRYHQGCQFAKKLLMIEPGLEENYEPASINRYTKHEIEHCMDLARGLGYEGPVPKVLFKMPENKLIREDLEKPIAVTMGYWKGDEFSLKKHWGNENFAKFVVHATQAGFNPVIFGGPADKDDVEDMLVRAEALDPKLKVRDRVLVLVDRTLVEQIYAFMQCKACVTNETAWTVISAMSVPCVSLVFSEAHNNPNKTYPYPSGIALVGTHDEMTEPVVWAIFMKMWNGGHPRRWSKVVHVGVGAVAVKQSPLHTLRAGLGWDGPKVSIVALLFDKGLGLLETAKRCVDAVRKTTPKDAEIILVANDPSPDLQGVMTWAQKVDSRVVGVSVGHNVGVVVKNLGYSLSQGEYVMSIDSDVVVEQGWVEKFVAFMDANPKVGLAAPCGGRLRQDLWDQETWPCGDFPDGPRTFFGYENAEYFGDQTESGKDGMWLDVAPSMCWCFRGGLLETAGYLDWRFGPFVGSDADFCFKVKLSGMGVSLVRVPIRHVHGGGSTHVTFSDLEFIRLDHIRELFKRWHPLAKKVCGLS